VEVYNGSNAQTQFFNEQPVSRTGKSAKAAPAPTRVDVINGSVKQMQVFADQSPSANSRPAHKRPRERSQRNIAQAAVSDVEIFNGTTKQRRVFKESPDAAKGAAAPHRMSAPVVVGITATGSLPNQRAAPLVVTGIQSGETDGTSKTIPPVAVGISPAPPKRPPYLAAPTQ
jgi:hypothetical protein